MFFTVRKWSVSRVSAYAGVDTERGDAACSVDRASNTKEELLEDYNLISERNFGYTEENPNSTKTKSPPKQTGLRERKLLNNRFKRKTPSSWSQRTIIEEDEKAHWWNIGGSFFIFCLHIVRDKVTVRRGWHVATSAGTWVRRGGAAQQENTWTIVHINVDETDPLLPPRRIPTVFWIVCTVYHSAYLTISLQTQPLAYLGLSFHI